jgi:hypothetical protein
MGRSVLSLLFDLILEHLVPVGPGVGPARSAAAPRAAKPV